MARYLNYKKKRDLSSQGDQFSNIVQNDEEVEEMPKIPERFKHVFHGGERFVWTLKWRIYKFDLL